MQPVHIAICSLFLAFTFKLVKIEHELKYGLWRQHKIWEVFHLNLKHWSSYLICYPNSSLLYQSVAYYFLHSSCCSPWQYQHMSGFHFRVATHHCFIRSCVEQFRKQLGWVPIGSNGVSERVTDSFKQLSNLSPPSLSVPERGGQVSPSKL